MKAEFCICMRMLRSICCGAQASFSSYHARTPTKNEPWQTRFPHQLWQQLGFLFIIRGAPTGGIVWSTLSSVVRFCCHRLLATHRLLALCTFVSTPIRASAPIGDARTLRALVSTSSSAQRGPGFFALQKEPTRHKHRNPRPRQNKPCIRGQVLDAFQPTTKAPPESHCAKRQPR